MRVVLIGLLLLSPLTALEARSDDGLQSLRELVDDGDYDSARDGASALVERLEAGGNGRTIEVAEALDVLVEANWRSGNASDPATRQAGLRALEIKREALGERHPGVADTLHQLGVVDFFLGEYDRARTVWLEALGIRQAALGELHADVAESMNALANLANVLHDFDEAERYYAGALRIREETLGPDHFRVGQTLNNLAVLRTEVGDLAGAIPLTERALEIKRATLGEDHPEVGSSLNNLGDLYDETGDDERALSLFERAAAVWEASLGPDHRLVGVALNNLAEQHREAGRLDDAAPLYERATSIWETAHGADHPRVALVCNNYGQLKAARGDWNGARALFERALSIREAALGAEHPDVAESLAHLADTLTRLGEHEKALRFYTRAVAIHRAALGRDNPELADAQLGLALLRAIRGEDAEAIRLALDSEAITRDHLRLTGRSLSAEHAVRYAAERRTGIDLALSLAVRHSTSADPAALLDAIIRSRAVVLDEMAARNRSVYESDDPATMLLAETLTDVRRRLANLTVRGIGDMDPDTYRELVESTRDEKERAERALAASSAEFATQQRRAERGLADVRGRLSSGDVLVAFVAYDHRELGDPTGPGMGRTLGPSVPSYAAVVLNGATGASSVVGLGPAETVDDAVAAWRREATRGALGIRRTPKEAEAAYRAAGRQLGDRVWTPIESRVDAADRVFVVPDGSINLVAFAALPTGESDYMIRTGPTLHYLSAERDLVAGDEQEPPGRGLLVLGAPDYDSSAIHAAASTANPAPPTRSSGCGGFENLRFDPLPAARLESDEVVALWKAATASESEAAGRVTYLHGATASESAFKSAAPGRRIVHLATHGFFLGGDCAGGGAGNRGLSVVDDPVARHTPTVRASPLLLSGLALAGANRRDAGGDAVDDGILTAEEIAGLDLSGVDWAVLSACDTGVGEIRSGEGVFGLRRAMQVAGVRTLIMSLWPVDDEATREWMTSLYRLRLIGGDDTAEAVRGAGREVLEARRARGDSTHPFYWAAFVAAGAWR